MRNVCRWEFCAVWLTLGFLVSVPATVSAQHLGMGFRVGEVTQTSAVVWTPALNLVEPLPTLSDRCTGGTQSRRLNNNGMVIGSSLIKARGRCRRHAVLWTKIIN